MTGNIVSFDIGSAQIKLVWCAGGVCKAAGSRAGARWAGAGRHHRVYGRHG